jgi:hypothetical protein
MPMVTSIATALAQTMPRVLPLRPLALAALVMAVGGSTVSAGAGDDALVGDLTAAHPPCMAGLADTTVAAGPDWRAVVDPQHAFGVLLPPGHELGRGDGVWYVFGTSDGAPLVPDVTIVFHAGHDAEAVLRDAFPEGAETSHVALGPATTGVRVTATFESPSGEREPSRAYLVEASEGTYSVWRYEGFDWEGFDAVACSFHHVELVQPGN